MNFAVCYVSSIASCNHANGEIICTHHNVGACRNFHDNISYHCVLTNTSKQAEVGHRSIIAIITRHTYHMHIAVKTCNLCGDWRELIRIFRIWKNNIVKQDVMLTFLHIHKVIIILNWNWAFFAGLICDSESKIL